jgi:acyl-CoA thioesterase-1
MSVQTRLKMTAALLLCLLAAVAPPMPAASSDVGEATILILGDSLSAAYGMERSQSWPALLQDRLDKDGHPYRVFNSSIAGDTTQGGLTRLPRLLEEHNPAVVIVELGGNDGLRGLPLDVTRSNIERMIRLSRDAGASVILAGIKIPPNYGPAYTRQFDAIYTSLAEEYGVALIPFFMEGVALEPDLMLEDGIHPNAAGQPVLLETVWRRLAPLL